MDLNLFRSKLNDYRRPTGVSQKALARALGLHPTILSNKLNGTDNARLTNPEIKRLLLILAEWGAFNERAQVNELLELAGLSPWQVFSREEWESSPLNQLHQTSSGETRVPVRLSEPENNQPSPEEVLPHYHKLPASFNPLIGRDEEISQIKALLKGTARLVTLTGPAGVGKTRIALEAGRQLLDPSRNTAFKDGVVWVELAPVNDPAQVAGIIARSLNIQEKVEEPLLDTLKAALRGRQLLVILDNFEQLVEGSSLLSELLAAAPALKFLVTSRETLQLYSEHPFPVEPWPIPALSVDLPLDGIINNHAVQLFLQRARAVKPDFALTLQNALDLVHICTMLDNLPLAIELAAAQIRLFSPGDIMAKLGEPMAFLKSHWRDVPSRQQALRQAFNWSYQLLNQKDQQHFRSLGVFRGSFSLEAVAAICGNEPEEYCPDPEQNEVVAGWLTQMAGKSLVRLDYESHRFGLLETLRQYALEKLKENEELARLSRRHAVYYLGQVESAANLLSGSQAEEGLATLDREYSNIRAALDWCLAQTEILIGYRLTVGLVNYWKIRGYAGDGWRWIEQILKLPFSLEDENSSQLLPWRAKVLSKAGNFATFRNDYYRAATLHEEALRLNRLTGDKAEIALCLNNLGVVRGYYQKYFDEGIELFEASLAIQRELGNREKVANIYNNLGLMAMRQNDYRKALYYMEESLAVSNQLDHKLDVAEKLFNIALVLLRLGERERAIACFEEVVRLSREFGYKRQLAYALNNLAMLSLASGAVGQGHKYAEESLAICREVEDKRGMAWAFLTLGHAALDAGNWVKAEALFKESESFYNSEGINIYQLEGLARLVHLNGETREASRLFAEAKNMREQENEELPQYLEDYYHK